MSFAYINMRRDAALKEAEPLKIRDGLPMLLDLDKCDVTQVKEFPIGANDMEAINTIGCIGTASLREKMAEPVNENQEGVYADVLPSGDHSSRMGRSGRGGGVSR
ncbi:hypothetical protein ANAPC1_00776 [Anaplasma phagocytophilum]|uniref:Uncharacterized protein n=2 Tax=Anaplasma phagocytophilum TaxID=948 RepID=A0AA45UT25_ANAPH|nr:hypothetical protein ANAPC1_00776 [Anaplasma phagocytophilum]